MESAVQVFQRAEVRDVLAWLRLLIEPKDAAAAVRALGRPPVELPQVDLARVVQIARRRRLDVVAALESATESAQLPPPTRERIQSFRELHSWAMEALDREPPAQFVEHLIERLGLRRRQLFAAQARDVEQRLAGLDRLCELAEDFARRSPGATPRQLAAHLAAVSRGGPPESRAPEAQRPEEADPEQAGARELAEMLAMLREEVLADVARIARRLGELRLDTDLDVSHGIVRYLELIKLAALQERPGERGAADVLPDINARLLAAATPLQREIYETSGLDALLLADSGAVARGSNGGSARAQLLAARGEPSLEPFLPRRGEGLTLSASDVETYRGCPLRYKFARVLRIPTEQTLAQRFGIVVHQVLERYHAASGQMPVGAAPAPTLEQARTGQTPGAQPPPTPAMGDQRPDGLMDLLDAAWRRAGFGESDAERLLRGKARVALTRYRERLLEEPAQPVWFERAFTFQLGPHHVRGRVDRVDRLPDGSYELIDYKTGYPKAARELLEDVQLSLYAIAAREAWGLEASRQAYYYLLDDRKVPVPPNPEAEREGAEWIAETVLRVGEGILAQDFEPTPSPSVCRLCDYRIVCPAAEQ
jgi:DNA helicase II / ATP-dependent DNA helicase PcrA